MPNIALPNLDLLWLVASLANIRDEHLSGDDETMQGTDVFLLVYPSGRFELVWGDLDYAQAGYNAWSSCTLSKFDTTQDIAALVRELARLLADARRGVYVDELSGSAA